jgi:hypothetical protein
MNKLEVKKVPFMGTELMAARDADGQIWAGVRWMCDGIGLSRNQRDNQIDKIKADTVLFKGAGNFPLPTNGGNQKCLCLKLDYVPLWLAKIAITPKMERETLELAAKLEQYQLRAKDVLAAAFLPQTAPEAASTSIQLRALTTDDYIGAARIVSDCRNERLHYVLGFLKCGGFEIPEVEARISDKPSFRRETTVETTRKIVDLMDFL